MKCPRCGADVQAQRFCIYCGERLCSHDSIRVQRAPSGVMRLRHRANISQTSLPEIQKKSENLKENKLASLSSQKMEKVGRSDDYVAAISSQQVRRVPCARPASPSSQNISKEGNEMKDSQSQRQSRELEALLSKLNGASSCENKAVEPEKHLDINLLMDEDEEALLDDDLSNVDEISDAGDAIDESMVSQTYSDSAFNSFFEVDAGEEAPERDISSSIPVGSGSFSRVPSGGFHLVIDSVKSACRGMINRMKSLRKPSDKQNADSGYYDESANGHRYAKIAVLAAILVAIVAVIVSVVSGSSEESAPEIAAQTTVAGNEDFAILPIEDADDDIGELTFDDDDFSIPAFDEPADTAVVAEAAPAPVPAPSAPGRLTEIRLYDQNDNVLAAVSEGEKYKTKNSCIMRQGPASRFGLVKQIPAGANIQILTNVDEDWILQGGGVWKKDGHPDKLGPGDQFADALKGMKLPQPKSRVISAKNWKYVQFGKVYGYVGPACFK